MGSVRPRREGGGGHGARRPAHRSVGRGRRPGSDTHLVGDSRQRVEALTWPHRGDA